MARQIGIDLGTANTLACIKGKGIVLRQPSVVAVNTQNSKVIAVGTDAKEMVGKTPIDIAAYRPLKDGVIADFDITKKMLRLFIKHIGGNDFIRPEMLICIPYGITEVERMAAEDAAFNAGARSVSLIEEPLAAAIGSGLDVLGSRGSMIIDIGGGTTEVAVLSLGGIVVSKSLRAAGDKMDEAIISHVRRKYGVLIGEASAEQVKMTVGSVHPEVDRGYISVIGRNLETGLPATVEVGSMDVEVALEELAGDLIEAIRKTLVETPPELSGDIYDDGIVLSGGGALLGGLSRLITDATGLRARVAESPLDGVIRGIDAVLENEKEYGSCFVRCK